MRFYQPSNQSSFSLLGMNAQKQLIDRSPLNASSFLTCFVLFFFFSSHSSEPFFYSWLLSDFRKQKERKQKPHTFQRSQRFAMPQHRVHAPRNNQDHQSSAEAQTEDYNLKISKISCCYLCSVEKTRESQRQDSHFSIKRWCYQRSVVIMSYYIEGQVAELHVLCMCASAPIPLLAGHNSCRSCSGQPDLPLVGSTSTVCHHFLL